MNQKLRTLCRLHTNRMTGLKKQSNFSVCRRVYLTVCRHYRGALAEYAFGKHIVIYFKKRNCFTIHRQYNFCILFFRCDFRFFFACRSHIILFILKAQNPGRHKTCNKGNDNRNNRMHHIHGVFTDKCRNCCQSRRYKRITDQPHNACINASNCTANHGCHKGALQFQ